jgi:hypothetical protein
VSQTSIADSLLDILNKGSHNEAKKVELHVELSKFYFKTDLDTAFYYGEKGLDIAKNNNDIIGLVEIYRVLGDIENSRGRFYDAKLYYLLADDYLQMRLKVK